MAGLVLDLSKGMSLDLTKAGDTKFTIGLGWEAAPVGGQTIDIDLSAFALVDQNGSGTHKFMELRDVVYHQADKSFEKHPSGCMKLSEDSQDGAKSGIDEELYVDVEKIPEHISAIAIYVNIFKPAVKFSQVQSAYAVVSNQSDTVLANFDMSAHLSDENSLLVGIIKRNTSNRKVWEFIAKGEGYLIQDLNSIVTSLNSAGLVA